MAVYTQLSSEAMAELVCAFDVGALLSAKGIAEGVENSNWLIDAERGRYILTIYEKRVRVEDLPFFLGLLDHLAERGCPAPRTIHDQTGAQFRFHEGKAAALIEFLPGVSLTEPSPAQAHAVGRALAQLHLAALDYPGRRANDLGLSGWRPLAERAAPGFPEIDPELGPLIARELDALEAEWPADLPQSTIHADLFPDNVLMLGDEVTGLIDFYFACTDAMAYDLAVTHSAWTFDKDGRAFDAAVGRALVTGYEEVRPLSPAERAALPVLARGSALRFTLTRAYDWVNTPAGALVTRKDPMAFARRLSFYAAAGQDAFA